MIFSSSRTRNARQTQSKLEKCMHYYVECGNNGENLIKTEERKKFVAAARVEKLPSRRRRREGRWRCENSAKTWSRTTCTNRSRIEHEGVTRKFNDAPIPSNWIY